MKTTHSLTRQLVFVSMMVVVLSLGAVHAFAQESPFALPTDDFQRVSDLVPLPDFIPGMGILFVDPATLPIGPFLGFARDGTLLHMTFMVPTADMEARKNFTDLAQSIDGFVVDHVDITYNPGHPGVEEPHYHIVLWRVTPEQEAELTK